MLSPLSPVRIADLEVGDDRPVAIIAETASSHEGDPALALHLLQAAHAAGADFVKFQLLRGDALLTPDHPYYPAFQIIQLPPDAWERVAAEGARIGARLIAEVFDEESLALATRLPFVALKIHSTDLSNPRMLDGAAASRLPVFVSSGGATFAEVEAAVARLQARGAAGTVLLHGFQSRPTRIEDSNLRQIAALRGRFGLHVGYADHVDADSELAFVLPAMAVGAGARVVEKHITHDRTLKGRDYFSALNPAEFERLVNLLRAADPAMGRSDDTLSAAELDYRLLMKKSIVTARPLDAGARVGEADLHFKRAPVAGLAPLEASRVVGRTIVRPLAAHAVVTEEDLS